MSDEPTHVSVELYVRSLTPDGPRPAIESIVVRLQRLDAAGAIDELAVQVTGRKVCPESATAATEPGQFLLERVASFHAWADRTGRSISSAFVRHEGVSGIDGSDHSGVTFPTMALAEYADDDLRFVSPAVEGATVHTVGDRLDVLEERTVNATVDGAGETVE